MNKKNDNKTILYQILISENINKSLKDNEDILFKIIPKLKYMVNFEHKHPHHHLNVWEHTKLALSLSECNFDIRLVLLLHDIGKPFSYQENNGIRHFKNHALKSSEMAKIILKNLDYDENYINKIVYLIKMHDSPITYNMLKSNFDLTYTLFQIQKCDALAHNPEKLEKRINYLNKTEDEINRSKKLKKSI